jgi:hypothetical protein
VLACADSSRGAAHNPPSLPSYQGRGADPERRGLFFFFLSSVPPGGASTSAACGVEEGEVRDMCVLRSKNGRCAGFVAKEYAHRYGSERAGI